MSESEVIGAYLALKARVGELGGTEDSLDAVLAAEGFDVPSIIEAVQHIAYTAITPETEGERGSFAAGITIGLLISRQLQHEEETHDGP